MPGASGSRDPRYDSPEWRELRAFIRKRDPMCKGPCGGYHRTRYADHIKPVRNAATDDPMFWDKANLQGLCVACHMLKSRREQVPGGQVTQKTPLVKGADSSGMPLDPGHHWNS